MAAPSEEYETMSVAGIARRLGVALLVILGVVALLGLFLREPLETWALELVAATGLFGIGALVFVGDPLPGVGFQPALFVGIVADVHSGPLYVVTAASTTLAAVASFALGRATGHLRPIRRLLQASGTDAAMDRWGFRALFISAVLPLPYGLATLAWGANGLPFRLLLLSALARWVKVAAFLGALQAGWSVTG